VVKLYHDKDKISTNKIPMFLFIERIGFEKVKLDKILGFEKAKLHKILTKN
jgi:hypothetical protein